MKDIFLTGIKPTGIVHIGNYFGAIKPSIELSQKEDGYFYYFIADYHALTTVADKQTLLENTYNVAATWLACGLDIEKVVFYKQSDIKEIFELQTILNNVTPKGLMNRAHAYKAKIDVNQEQNQDLDFGVNMGLYNYPILMAADILMFNSTKVPVGLDQKQHIEIARDIAGSFNARYGKTLMLPQEFINEDVATIPGLDGRKMSKSYGNQIELFCDEKTLRKKINSIVTDSSLPTEPKSINCQLFNMYKLFATKEEAWLMEKCFKEGISWADAKAQLFEVINRELAPMREKYNYYQSHRELIDEYLRAGAEKARKISSQTLERVRKAIGV